MPLEPLIPSCISDLPADAAGLARATATYATRPSLRCKTTWSGSGLTRTLTVQVRNQKKQDCAGYYLVCVLLGTDGGSATPAFTVTNGVQLDEFTETQGGVFLTDASGKVVLSVTQTSAWTALVERASAVSPIDGPTAAAWAPATSGMNTGVLASDQTNNNAVANTLQDVTGLGFSVTAGQTYWFRFVVDYTAAATTTGSRWTLNTPTTTRLSYRSQYSLTATSDTFNSAVAAGVPAASNASSANTTGNVAVVEGFITPSANGTVQLQFASGVSASAIVAKAGSVMQWSRVV